MVHVWGQEMLHVLHAFCQCRLTDMIILVAIVVVVVVVFVVTDGCDDNGTNTIQGSCNVGNGVQ